MQRRTFIGGSAAILTAPLFSPGVVAGQPAKLPVIGILHSGSPGPYAPNVAAFRQGLSEAGYVEGQNVVIEYRWAEGLYDRLPALVADLVGHKVDVIAALGGAPSALAAKTATSAIPIVFSVGDPVERGLVASLARPGGNLTGVASLDELTSKRLELLSELVSPGQGDRPLGELDLCERARHTRCSGSGRREGAAAPDPEGRHR
jgi:putative ABC transport system substrate-binding protein